MLDDESIASLGERVDDLMFARVRHEGLFFQHDANTGRYEDLQFGLGWQGPSACYRKIEKLERDPLFRAWIENPLFERIARAHIDGPIALYRAVLFTKAATGTRFPGIKTAASSGASIACRPCRSGPRSTMRRSRPVASK